MRGNLRVATALTVAALLWPGTGGVCAASRADEYQVKAAFLFNFAKFVSWNSPPGQVLVIGVVGDDPFGEILDATVRGKTAGGRTFEVRRFAKGESVQGCHILFVSSSEKRRFGDLVRQAGSGVLTVGEVPQFVREGGVVRFYLEQNRVRFQINAEAAEQAGLKIHSQLLSLAAQ
jgi:hypothetical protein